MTTPGETKTEVQRYSLFYVGMPSNDALWAANALKYTAIKEAASIGKDANGMIVEWYFKGVTLEFRRRWSNETRTTEYRITKITPEPEDDGEQ